jgi:hypothetical protein
MMGPPPGMGHQPGMGHPGMAPQMGRPPTDQVRPLQAPPYLASQTAARMDAPVDPWAGSLKILMLVFGLLLVVGWVAPHSVVGKTIFSWTELGKQPNAMRIENFMILGTGLLAITMALTPVEVAMRGAAAALLGLAPLIFLLVGKGKVAEWQTFVTLLAPLPLIAGLLVRAQYRSSIVGRLMTTVGVIGVLLLYVIPMAQYGDKMLLIEGFKGIGDAEGRMKIGAIVAMLPLILAVVSLLVWLPASTSAGATVIAWIWIVLPAITVWAMWAIGHDPVEALKTSLKSVLWMPIAWMAWNTFFGYGTATLVGKQLEHA